MAVNVLKMLPDFERHLVLLEPRIAYSYDATLHTLSGDFTSGAGRVTRAWQLAANVRSLTQVKRSLPNTTWVSFTTWANVLNVLTPGSGVTILSSHNHESSNIGGRYGALLRGLVRYTYPRADAVVTVSEAVKRDLVDSFGVPASHVRTIYNTVDIHEAARLAVEEPASTLAETLRHPTIVTAGSLARQKGQWHLIRAFADLKRHEPDARLLILGEGPLGSYLGTLARAAGLSTWAAWDAPGTDSRNADVVFAGFQKNPFAIFARAAVFAFPSLWEGFGNVVVEALACGALVLAADCKSGPREILAPGSPELGALREPEHASAGVLMPVFDGLRRDAAEPLSPAEQVWSAALLGALSDRSLRARYEGPARARAAAFGLDRIAPEWQRLLAQSGFQ